MRFTFKKEERLAGKKTFDQLFKSGKSIVVSPLRLVWLEIKKDKNNGLSEEWNTRQLPNSPTVQHSNIPSFQYVLGISVPKKLFAKAVDRNTIKRRIRESYRKNIRQITDYEFLQKKNLHIALMIIYIAKEKLSYQEIEKKMIVSLQKLRYEI